jgi:hypothetical protein
MTELTVDKRRFHRILYQSDVLLTQGDQSALCEILDLSLKGCLLKLPEEWSSNLSEHYKLSISLSDESKIEMQLVLAYHKENKGGFYCDKIDLNSISQLRRLIELNLGDSQLLERDLDALSHAEKTES